MTKMHGFSDKAVFFDRDGVINDDTGHYYVHRVEDLKINPGTVECMKELQERGYKLLVITNQGGIARGQYSIEDTDRFHAAMMKLLEDKEIHITAIYFCPHHHTVEKCLCRKPEGLLLEKAMARYNIDPEASYFIGDKESDMEAGRRAGVKGILIQANSDLRQVLDKIN